MNKILRYSFVALMAMLFGNVMADDVFTADFSYATGEGLQVEVMELIQAVLQVKRFSQVMQPKMRIKTLMLNSLKNGQTLAAVFLMHIGQI